MLLVLKRTVSMRLFFLAPNTNVKTDGEEIVHNFILNIVVHQDLYHFKHHCLNTQSIKVEDSKDQEPEILLIYDY